MLPFACFLRSLALASLIPRQCGRVEDGVPPAADVLSFNIICGIEK